MKLKITIDNRTYDVDVEVSDPDSSAPTGYLGPSEPYGAPEPKPVPIAPPSTAGDFVCRSPVSGVVVRVVAQVGQTIGRGDVLIVLDAMKMETNITAASGGVVKAVVVKPGDSVRSGQIVVEFE